MRVTEKLSHRPALIEEKVKQGNGDLYQFMVSPETVLRIFDFFE